ncbi:hypothetical protein GALL_525320 [mine drainage metagenome]|uniref:Uncharacterized protein n=1 Tax=mine drainage metagenome TaxID=410659 RepID=A0A1J5P2X3_9ZZZZ
MLGDAPVVPRTIEEEVGVRGRGHGGAHAADAALAVGHGTVLFAPGGGRQQQVGIVTGGRRGKSLLHDDECGTLQGAAHSRLVGHRLGRVGADDPQRLDLAIGGGLKHFDRRASGFFGHTVHTPQGGHFGAVLRVGQVAVGREQIGQATHFPPAHGVGLAGQAERPGTRFTDLARGQVQVDQRGVLGGTAAGLVEPLAIQTERGLALANGISHARKPARRREQVVLGQTAQAGHIIGCEVTHPRFECVKAVGMGSDIGVVDPALPQHDVQQAMKQGNVGAGLQGQVQVGQTCGVGTPGVGDNDF